MSACPAPHRMFTISICDGIGGAWVCLQSLGMVLYGVSVEKEPNLAAFVRHKFPRICTFVDALKLTVDMLFRWAAGFGGIFLSPELLANPSAASAVVRDLQTAGQMCCHISLSFVTAYVTGAMPVTCLSTGCWKRWLPWQCRTVTEFRH